MTTNSRLGELFTKQLRNQRKCDINKRQNLLVVLIIGTSGSDNG